MLQHICSSHLESLVRVEGYNSKKKKEVIQLVEIHHQGYIELLVILLFS